MKNRVIKVDTLARVEGEGGVTVKISDGKVGEVKLRIYEPPRFFEAFLRGRSYHEIPDITARICGICPVAYQMSSVHAIEDAFGIEVNGPLRELRRLIYCGEWIESHVLHVSMLHAPDFLGFDDALAMAKVQPELVTKALRMKKIGNEVVIALGGREIHPINVKVGGFYKVPAKKELTGLLEPLKWGRDSAVELAKVVATLNFPEFDQEYEFVSLTHPDEYPFNGGRIISARGLDIAINEYEFYFEERHIGHSNALHSVEKGFGPYHVGPLARFNLNFEKLSPIAKAVAKELGILPKIKNPFKSIVVRAIETIHAYEEAIRIIEGYSMPDAPAVNVHPRAAIGFGASEAPRGMLYHRYRFGDDGSVLDAKIVPPTAQNLPTIEQDLRQFAMANLDLDREQLTWKLEQTVRNYDPCISCATHFVRITDE
jgi:coenzyme F420-reducing hydrogenase alpha subunit